MRRLELHLIALPRALPQQAEIPHKVPPHGAELTELGRVLDDGVVDGYAAVLGGEGEEPLEGTREGEADRPVCGASRERERGCAVEGVLGGRSERSMATGKRETDHCGLDRPVIRGERDGRTSVLGTSLGPDQPYVGVHRAGFGPQTQILALLFRFGFGEGG